MSSAKIDIAIGEVRFSGEGTETWVAEQLEKVLATAQVPQSNASVPRASEQTRTPASNSDPVQGFNDSLASFIKRHDGDTNKAVFSNCGVAPPSRRGLVDNYSRGESAKGQSPEQTREPLGVLEQMLRSGLVRKNG
jgi:hypothetical protein